MRRVLRPNIPMVLRTPMAEIAAEPKPTSLVVNTWAASAQNAKPRTELMMVDA